MPTDKIPLEWLAAYIDGTATPEQVKEINQIMKNDPEAYSEFLLAARGAYLAESENEEPEIKLGNMNIAAGLASVTGGAGLADYLLQGHREVDMVASRNNSEEDDRSDDPDGSISEKTNMSMENDHYFQQNPVQQQYNDSCAIKSQQLILNDFGVPVTEDQLINQAEQFDLYTPGSGTAPQDVGKLLELNGVSCTQHECATIYDLTDALARGQKVIIGVDSSELWNKDFFAPAMNKITDSFSGEKADHALIVAGIDTTDPNQVQVVLTDPGTGEEAARYPMEQFLDAWHDSGNFMVTTDNSAPLAYNPGMINFDYSLNHIPNIGNMPYEFFEQHILPLSQELSSDESSMEMLHDDFSAMTNGDFSNFSPALISAIENTPFADKIYPHDMPDCQANPPSNEISFGSKHMADYYEGWAKHHEEMAKRDLEHGDYDSAKNHLNYARDNHDHSLDELNTEN